MKETYKRVQRRKRDRSLNYKIYYNCYFLPPGFGRWGFLIVKGKDIIYQQSEISTVKDFYELWLICVINALAYFGAKHLHTAKEAVLYCSNVFIYVNIKKNMHKWQRNDWCLENGNQVKYKEYWQKVYKLRNDYGMTFKLRRIRALNKNMYMVILQKNLGIRSNF